LLLLLLLLLPLLSLLLVLQGQLSLFVHLSECLYDIRLPPGGRSPGRTHVGGACNEGVLIRIWVIMVSSAFVTLSLLLVLLLLLLWLLLLQMLLLLLLLPELLHLLLLLLRYALLQLELLPLLVFVKPEDPLEVRLALRLIRANRFPLLWLIRARRAKVRPRGLPGLRQSPLDPTF
jgi:hypothetical protein